MTARLLDGKALAKKLNASLAARVRELSRPPGLAVVLVGSDPASQVYVRLKGRVAERLGFLHRQVDLPATIPQAELMRAVEQLNRDPDIDGVLVQLPLPPHLDPIPVMDAIHPEKDVDGFNALNAGLLAQGRPQLIPCTPQGVMRLLEEAEVPLRGREAVVVGRSNIVGRPMAFLLEQADCTVTLCHRHTRHLEAAVRRAEILVVAVGQPGLIPGAWVREGAVVVDVGINRLDDGRLVGDVAFEEARLRASAISPVPGGVGPLTIAMLMENTVRASVARQGGPSLAYAGTPRGG